MSALTLVERTSKNGDVAKRGRPPKNSDSTAQKPGADRSKDRHVYGFMVRLPDAYRDLLNKIGDPELTYTVKVRRAVDFYLKANNITPPKPE